MSQKGSSNERPVCKCLCTPFDSAYDRADDPDRPRIHAMLPTARRA